MITWFEVSSGAIANAELAESTLRMSATGLRIGRIFYSLISICHAGIVARARELPRLNFDQPLKNELRHT
jgi:hypothetical protein